MGNEILDPCEIGSGSCRRRWYSERERSIAERWIFAEFGEDARKFSYRGACAYGIAQRTPASNIHRISDRIIFFFSSSFLSQNVVGFRNSRPTSSRPTSFPAFERRTMMLDRSLLPSSNSFFDPTYSIRLVNRLSLSSAKWVANSRKFFAPRQLGLSLEATGNISTGLLLQGVPERHAMYSARSNGPPIPRVFLVRSESLPERKCASSQIRP